MEDKYPPPDARSVKIGENADKLPRDEITKEEEKEEDMTIKELKTKRMIKSIMDDIIEAVTSLDMFPDYQGRRRKDGAPHMGTTEGIAWRKKHEASGDYDSLMRKFTAARKVNEKKCKGSGCSKSGNKYEIDTHNILKFCSYENKPFNTQNSNELGGSSANHDIACNHKEEKDIGIEAKSTPSSPDYMQCTLKYNHDEKRWRGSERCKIPKESRDLFIYILKEKELFKNKAPPKNITLEEWHDIKKSDNVWEDHYIYDIPNNTIAELYKFKGCSYIQLGKGYGLYHLGNDRCNFGVPEFNTKQRIRIRIKVHFSKKSDGNCRLAIMASAQPYDIENIEKSPYSLDDISKLPPNLVYQLN